MVIAVLIILNIPVYLFLGWVAFDSKENAGQTLAETAIAVLKIIFVPSWLRMVLGMDTEGSMGLFPIGAFLFACSMITYGEFILLTKIGWA